MQARLIPWLLTLGSCVPWTGVRAESPTRAEDFREFERAIRRQSQEPPWVLLERGKRLVDAPIDPGEPIPESFPRVLSVTVELAGHFERHDVGIPACQRYDAYLDSVGESAARWPVLIQLAGHEFLSERFDRSRDALVQALSIQAGTPLDPLVRVQASMISGDLFQKAGDQSASEREWQAVVRLAERMLSLPAPTFDQIERDQLVLRLAEALGRLQQSDRAMDELLVRALAPIEVPQRLLSRLAMLRELTAAAIATHRTDEVHPVLDRIADDVRVHFGDGPTFGASLNGMRYRLRSADPSADAESTRALLDDVAVRYRRALSSADESFLFGPFLEEAREVFEAVGDESGERTVLERQLGFLPKECPRADRLTQRLDSLR